MQGNLDTDRRELGLFNQKLKHQKACGHVFLVAKLVAFNAKKLFSPGNMELKHCF
jgi:hypothetical protein